MSDAASERIQVQCHCGVKLKVPASAAGRRAKCPKCGDTFTVQAPMPPVQTTADDDWLSAAAAREQSASAVAVAAPPAGGVRAVGAVKPCPKCGMPVAAGAVLCTSCGHNMKTGRGAKAAWTGPSAGEAAGKVAKAAGTFVIGCVLSGVAAALGAGLWYFIAMKTNMEFGYVAWAVGLASGFGMTLGCRNGGVLAGVIAATFALLSIIGAKVLILFAVLAAVFSGDTTNRDFQKVFVARHLTDQALSDKGIAPDQATEQQSDKAYADAERRVERMSKDEFKREYERCLKADAAAAAAEAKELARSGGSSGGSPPPNAAEADEETGGAGQALAGAFFSSMFGFLDVVFLLLAVGTAFKVGANGFTFGGSS